MDQKLQVLIDAAFMKYQLGYTFDFSNLIGWKYYNEIKRVKFLSGIKFTPTKKRKRLIYQYNKNENE